MPDEELLRWKDEGMPAPQIAKRSGLGLRTVYRRLEQPESPETLAQKLESVFSLGDAIVVSVPEKMAGMPYYDPEADDDLQDELAIRAASLLRAMIRRGDHVAISAGRSMHAMAKIIASEWKWNVPSELKVSSLEAGVSRMKPWFRGSPAVSANVLAQEIAEALFAKLVLNYDRVYDVRKDSDDSSETMDGPSAAAETSSEAGAPNISVLGIGVFAPGSYLTCFERRQLEASSYPLIRSFHDLVVKNNDKLQVTDVPRYFPVGDILARPYAIRPPEESPVGSADFNEMERQAADLRARINNRAWETLEATQSRIVVAGGVSKTFPIHEFLTNLSLRSIHHANTDCLVTDIHTARNLLMLADRRPNPFADEVSRVAQEARHSTPSLS